MLTRQETTNAAYAEMLRFSVAISLQLERIDQRKTELREARGQYDEASFREIFAAKVPVEDFERHLRALKQQFELVPKMHLKSEVQFLLIAVRGMYAMALALRWGVSEDDAKVRSVQSAISAFEKAAPDAVHLRNLHEHMDEVFRGRGDAYKKLPDPSMEGAIALLEHDVAYEIGGKVWKIGDVAVAAKDLLRDVGRCVNG